MEYIILKCNTTGLKPDEDKLTEVCAFLCNGESIKKQYHTLVNPETPLSEEVIKITGLTNDMLKDAPLYEDVKDDLLSFIGDRVIVGHNINFDLSFLKLGLDNQVIDTMRIAKAIFGYDAVQNYRLKTICNYLNIKEDCFVGISHTARITQLMFEKMLPLLADKKRRLEEANK